VNLEFVSNEAAESCRFLLSSSSPRPRPRRVALWGTSSGNETIIEALIPTPQMATWVTPENKPEQIGWFWVDVHAMAQYVGWEAANIVHSWWKKHSVRIL
jgi:cytochrome oxidase assembly protein ShyY1